MCTALHQVAQHAHLQIISHAFAGFGVLDVRNTSHPNTSHGQRDLNLEAVLRTPQSGILQSVTLCFRFQCQILLH